MVDDGLPSRRRRNVAAPPAPPYVEGMLRNEDVERLVRQQRHGAPTAGQSLRQRGARVGARDLQSAAELGMSRAAALGDRAKVSVVEGARKASERFQPRVPFVDAFGARRAGSAEGGEDGEGGEGAGEDGGKGGGGGASVTRVVWINQVERNAGFASNYISTTKYSPWKAVPQFLFEQFTRFSNAYFLFVGILYCIDAVSPVFTIGRYAILWVLIFVITISGIKEIIEDLRRYRQDRGVNRAPTQVLGAAGATSRWDEVKVGDIVKVRAGETFPADLVLLASSSDDGLAFVETKQLDGESNLKVKVVPQQLSEMFASDAHALLVRGRVECEAPNDRLYQFHGSCQLEGTGVSRLTDASSHLSAGELSDAGVDGPSEVTAAHGAKFPLGAEHLLIRGSSLRNTEFVLGLAVNTGRDTKLMQNVKPRSAKVSRLEHMINRFLLVSLVLQIAIVFALTIRSSQVCTEQFVDGFAWYLLESDSCSAGQSALRFLTFFATFSGLLPISLYVSMEITRGFQVYFMVHDEQMKDHETGIAAEVRTSNLNEDLGVVDYLFSDKTGTLTANKMDFKKCSLAGRVYSWSSTPARGTTSLAGLRDAIAAGVLSSAAASFTPLELEVGEVGLRLLAICHSVVAESIAPDGGSPSATGSKDMPTISDLGEHCLADVESASRHDSVVSARSAQSAILAAGSGLKYQASSPDEAALVMAASANGFTFVSRSNQDLVIQVNGEYEEYELLEVLEFDSTRKRMSVIVRCPNGQIRLFAKGADSVIFNRLAVDQDPTATAQHLHDFAVEGLRTLCLAYRDIDESFYQQWKHRFMQSSSRVDGREEAVAAVAAEMETNLVLLGATAIEDKLQIGVPETLRMLERANVKIWVLTGDKQETAINVGLSCGAIVEGMDVYIINEDNGEDTAAQIDCAIGRWKALLHDQVMERKLCLVVDGQTLHFALRPEMQTRLMHLCRMARSVIACRVSPKQKAELVEMVRRHEKGKVTCSIGDGANDVGMIQAAHVGIGIVGLEGQEAKLASDYSIGQFRFLQRLMLVHGRWSYKRLSKMILYTMYKNMTLVLCEMYWASFSAFSGQPLFDPWMPGIYNVLSSSLPPILLGIFDQELAAPYALSFPEIYVKGQRNTACNLRVFFHWISSALWQSALIFFLAASSLGDRSNAQELGVWAFGCVVFTLVVVVVHCFALLYQASWTVLTASLFALSFFSWFIIAPLFSWEPVALYTNFAPALSGVMQVVLADPRMWMLIVLVPLLCVSPTLLWKFSKRQRRPNLKMLAQELMRSGRTREDVMDPVTPKPLPRLPSYDPEAGDSPTGSATFVKGERQFTFSGFNFDGDESVSLLVSRHAYANSKGVRRRRMRVLKRAGSDTELDVAGVQTVTTPSSSDALQASDVSDFAVYGHRSSGRRRVPPAEVLPFEDDRVGREVPKGKVPASHRRALSDGAVLVEERYSRVENRDGADVGVRGAPDSLVARKDESEL